MTETFEKHRPRLLSLAYRLLGSWAEAEDVVQDAWTSWAAAQTSTLEAPGAWLQRVVTHRCLDVLKSARVSREAYVGPWLPEPVETPDDTLAGSRVDPETISLAFLALLERLSPLERAVYLLAEAFDFTHDEIARTLEREPPAVRQLLHRARAHVREGRPRFAPSKEDHARLLGAFMRATAEGDVARLEALLAQEVVLRSDGGGRVKAALQPVSGPSSVARFVLGLSRKRPPGLTIEERPINGRPAIVVFIEGVAAYVLDLETDGHRIYGVHLVANPEKLRHIAPPR